MNGNAAFNARLHLGRQIGIGGMHIAELRGPQNLAVAPWHTLGVQHIGQRDFLGIGHIRVPALAGII